MPAYFKEIEYRLPRSSNDGPLQYAYGTDKDSYTYWATEKPATMANFNVFMQGLFGTPQRLGWLDWFPFKAVCSDEFDASKSDYLFVDVAGGKGHECELLLNKHSGLKGKLALEELPFVIEDITNLDERVERAKHDFMKPQPIKGKPHAAGILNDLSLIDRSRCPSLFSAKHLAQLGIARLSRGLETPQRGNDSRIQQAPHWQHHST